MVLAPPDGLRLACDLGATTFPDARSMQQEVVLVDRHDRRVGVSDLAAAHTSPGLLHRGVSVVLWTRDGRIALQRRAATKYPFGGLWATSASGHPAPGESFVEAAQRHVLAELGVMPTALSAAGRFVYVARDRLTGIVEREVRQVAIGLVEDVPNPAPRHVDDLAILGLETLEERFEREPRAFNPSFGAVIDLAVAASRRVWDNGSLRPVDATDSVRLP